MVLPLSRMSLQMRCPFEPQIIECTGDIDMREPSLSGPLLEAALRWGQQLPAGMPAMPCSGRLFCALVVPRSAASCKNG